jgi:leucyl aminopeptidase
VAPATDGSVERVLFGLGETLDPMLFGALARDLPTADYRIEFAPRECSGDLAAIAWALGAYTFHRYKARRKTPPRLVMGDGMDRAEVRRVAAAVWFARDLVNTPANDMGPEKLHAAAAEAAQTFGAAFEAIVGADLLARNFPMIHAVGRASDEAPRILRLTWGDATAPKLAIVGKGVTFDSGGLDIKPDSAMRIMKKDMGGAATALALGRLVMDAQLPVRLEVVLPVVENAVGAGAFRPGDIVPTRKGLSIEIDNTDAEGRLILADALALASESKPALMLDFATLTGAARVALGPEITPFYTADEKLAADLAAASGDARDPLWRMPLWGPYEADLDSPVADLKNGGDASFAGSIYAALFLKKFADAPAWAHFDMYAWSPKDKPARPAGGDAQSLRACWALLKRRFAR